MAGAGDDNEGAAVGVSRDFDATCSRRGECNMPIARIWKGISAQRVMVILNHLICSIQVLHRRGLHRENRGKHEESERSIVI